MAYTVIVGYHHLKFYSDEWYIHITLESKITGVPDSDLLLSVPTDNFFSFYIKTVGNSHFSEWFFYGYLFKVDDGIFLSIATVYTGIEHTRSEWRNDKRSQIRKFINHVRVHLRECLFKRGFIDWGNIAIIEFTRVYGFSHRVVYQFIDVNVCEFIFERRVVFELRESTPRRRRSHSHRRYPSLL